MKFKNTKIGDLIELTSPFETVANLDKFVLGFVIKKDLNHTIVFWHGMDRIFSYSNHYVYNEFQIIG